MKETEKNFEEIKENLNNAMLIILLHTNTYHFTFFFFFCCSLYTQFFGEKKND